MKTFTVAVFAICCLVTAKAKPGFLHGSAEQLIGVPDVSSYEKLSYPKYDLLELGSIVKNDVPPAVIHITKEVTIKEPQPYPVKVPVPVPHPVPVAKPYPVVETKIIKVPHPVPYEVIKKIPVPFEVPKPYPVPSDELKGGGGGHQDVSSYGGSFGGHGISAGYHQIGSDYQQQGGSGVGGGYGGFESDGGSYGGHGESDQSGGYQAVAQISEGGYGEQGGEQQTQEEQH